MTKFVLEDLVYMHKILSNCNHLGLDDGSCFEEPEDNDEKIGSQIQTGQNIGYQQFSLGFIPGATPINAILPYILSNEVNYQGITEISFTQTLKKKSIIDKIRRVNLPGYSNSFVSNGMIICAQSQPFFCVQLLENYLRLSFGTDGTVPRKLVNFESFETDLHLFGGILSRLASQLSSRKTEDIIYSLYI